MDKSIHFYFVLIIGVLKDLEVVGVSKCDGTTTPDLPGGELGLLGTFPWLGLLRVHLHESKKTASSGVVLVRDRYAIGVAEDIAKIPLRVFREESDILFVPSTGHTWVCGLLDYLTHPDYDRSITTIVLLELDLGGRGQVPFSAVCWTRGARAINLNELYTVGYSAGLEGMEYGKMILKLQYVNKTSCEEYYTSNAVSSPQGFPAESLCAAAVGPESEDCVWDMGQALVSNATGSWTLIGLSVSGPACSEPGRFLNFLHYREWVQSALDPTFRYQEYRRTGLGTGFQKKKKAEIQDIPISRYYHTVDYSGRRQAGKPTLKSRIDPKSNVTQNVTNAQNVSDPFGARNVSGRLDLQNLSLSLFPYPFKDPETHFDLVVDRVDKDAINISVFSLEDLNTMLEDLSNASQRVGLKMNMDKTKIISNAQVASAPVNVKNITLEVVDHYVYLRQTVQLVDSKYEIQEGACHRYNHLVYRDRTRVVAKGKSGTAAYRLTLYDMLLNNITCIQIEAKSLSRSQAKLWWTTFLDKTEMTAFKLSGNTPEEMLKIIPVKPLYPKKPDPNGKFNPKDYYHLEAQSIKDQFDTMHIINVNLLVTLEFRHEAMLHLKIYGQPAPRPTTTTTEPPTSTSEPPPVTFAAPPMSHLVNEATFDFKVDGLGEPYKDQDSRRRSNNQENPYDGIPRIRLWSDDDDDKLREKPLNRKNIPRKNGNKDSFNGVRDTAHSRKTGVFYNDEGRVAVDTESEPQNKNIRRKNGNKNSFNGVRETAHSRKTGVFYNDEGRVAEGTEAESQNKNIRPKNRNKGSFKGVRETAHSGEAGVFYNDEGRVAEGTESEPQNKNIRRKNGNKGSFNGVRETAYSGEAGAFYNDKGRVAENTELEPQNKNIRRKHGNKNSFNGVPKTAYSDEAGVFYNDEGRVAEDTVSESQIKQEEPSLVLWI